MTSKIYKYTDNFSKNGFINLGNTTYPVVRRRYINIGKDDVETKIVLVVYINSIIFLSDGEDLDASPYNKTEAAEKEKIIFKKSMLAYKIKTHCWFFV